MATDLSVTTIAAIAAGGAILIGAFFAGIVSVITAWRTIAQKVTAIEGHVNSEKTASEGREASKDREILLLREMLNDRRQTAALLAQAASHAIVVSPVAALPATEVTMQAVNAHVEAIETNTAKTEQAVHKLQSTP